MVAGISARNNFDQRLRDGEKSGKTWERALSAERHQLGMREIIGSLDDVEHLIGLFISPNLFIMLIESLSNPSLAVLWPL